MDTIEGRKTIKTFYRKILDGEYGLAKTFWLGALGSNVAIQFVYNAVFQTRLIESLLTVFVCSMLIVWWRYITLIGTWRACATSTTHKAFIYIIKGLVVFWIIANTVDCLYILRVVPYL